MDAPVTDDSAIDFRRPFTRADAIDFGIAPRVLRGSRFRRIFRGVYVDATVVNTPQQRVEAALALFGDEAFASHASAARIHGVPIPSMPDEHVTVATAAHRRPRPGIHCHVAAAAAQTQMVAGVRVSDYAQMFVELADLVIIGDNLVRSDRLTREQLVEHCRTSNLPGRVRPVGQRRTSGTGSTLRWRADCGCFWCSQVSPSPRSTSSTVLPMASRCAATTSAIRRPG